MLPYCHGSFVRSGVASMQSYAYADLSTRAQTSSSNALTHEFRAYTYATVYRCRSNLCTKTFACWRGSYKTQRTSISVLRSTSVRSKRRLCVPTSRKRGQLPTQTRAYSASTRTTRHSRKRNSNGPYLFQATSPVIARH